MAKGRPPSCTCGTCPRCVANAKKRLQYRALDEVQRRARVKRRDPIKNAIRQRRESLKHDRRYPERAAARDAVQRALRAGQIKRQPCKVCGVVHGQRLPSGRTAKVEAHHENYGRPLDVVWVCTDHHKPPYIKEPNP